MSKKLWWIILVVSARTTFAHECEVSGCSYCSSVRAECEIADGVIPADLPNTIQFLSLHYIGTPTRLDHELAGFLQLENVTISGNVLSIARSAFANQHHLKRLIVIDTKIKELPDNLFASNTSLLELNLERNKLSQIPVNLFNQLVGLKTLNLAYNCIKLANCYTIGSAFTHLVNLCQLNLAKIAGNESCSPNLNNANFFSSINNRLLALNISGSSKIIFGEKGSEKLRYFIHLEDLDLSNIYRYSNCPQRAKSIFSKLPQSLRRLSIRQWRTVSHEQPQCELNFEAVQGLRELPNLLELDMKYSDLIVGHMLLDSIFANFTSLETLNLAWCRISSIQPFAFNHCPNLTSIILDGNPLGSRESKLQSPDATGIGLRRVNLRRIGLASDETQFFLPIESILTPKLEFLNLEENILRTVPLFSFDYQSKGHNRRRLEQDVCETSSNDTVNVQYTPKLNTLVLDNNHIKHFLEAAHKFNWTAICDQMPALTNLSMTNNVLEDITGLCPSLEVLELGLNHLGSNWQTNEPVLASLNNLKHLNISYNRINKMSAHFLSRMVALENIDLSSNKINSLESELFDKNRKLRYINLAFNKLIRFELGTILPLQKLEVLYLHDNKIGSFTQDFLNHLANSSIREIHIYGNRFQCDCNLEPFQQFLMQNSKGIFIPRYKELRCFGNHHNHTVCNYKRNTFKCDYFVPVIVVVSLVGSVVLTLLIGIPCYKYRWYVHHPRVVWRAFIHQLREIQFDQGCSYDAFISYDTESDADCLFVKDVILPAVAKTDSENTQERMCRLWVYDRDSTPGLCRHTERCEVLAQSRKVIILLSNSYISSEQCRGEADLAGREMYGLKFYQPNKILVIVKERLNNDKIVAPITALLTENVISIYDVNDQSTMKGVWERVRRFLIKPRYVYQRRVKPSPSSEALELS